MRKIIHNSKSTIDIHGAKKKKKTSDTLYFTLYQCTYNKNYGIYTFFEQTHHESMVKPILHCMMINDAESEKSASQPNDGKTNDKLKMLFYNQNSCHVDHK